jgi:hypothetical protein
MQPAPGRRPALSPRSSRRKGEAPRTPLRDSVRRHRRALRGCLFPSGTWSGFRVAASCSRLNDCHQRPVNTNASSWRHADRRNSLYGQELRQHLIHTQPHLYCQPLSRSLTVGNSKRGDMGSMASQPRVLFGTTRESWASMARAGSFATAWDCEEFVEGIGRDLVRA